MPELAAESFNMAARDEMGLVTGHLTNNLLPDIFSLKKLSIRFYGNKQRYMICFIANDG